MSYNIKQSSEFKTFLNKSANPVHQNPVSNNQTPMSTPKNQTPITPPTPVKSINQKPPQSQPPRDITKKNSNLESIAYYFFLGVIILAPIIFWANPYISQDLVKTFVIAFGTIVATILFGFIFIKERRLILPSKNILWISILMILSLLISAINSIHVSKSLFGQGFEIGTASFIAILFLSALVAFTIINRRPDRTIVTYVGMVISFSILYIFQLLRVIFGSEYMSLKVFNSVTSSLIGGWYNIGSLSVVILIISLLAIMILPLSRKMRIAYWIISILSIVGIIVVNDPRVWSMSALVFFGLTIYLTFSKTRSAGGVISSFIKRISWIPLLACLLSVLFFYQGSNIASPTISKINLGYSEIRLPWQMTLDVTASSIKNYPLFGVGPNHFSKAFLAYKPNAINQTNFWNIEFTSGFGLIPTFVATQGIVGAILWILFFVLLGIIGKKVLTNLPQESDRKFLLLSSYSSSVFLWLMAIMSVPSHAIMLYTFVMTGIFVGLATSYNLLSSKTFSPIPNSRLYKIFPSIMAILVLIVFLWGLVYLKKTVAMFYFASGVKQLSLLNNTKSADAAFAKALIFDKSDIYWQARAETTLAETKKLVATVTSASTTAESEIVAKQINEVLTKGITYTRNAINYDKSNYYNYLSEARISEMAANLRVDKAYDNAVNAYSSAINMNLYNPSIYLSLANLQANNNKLDDAIRTLGATLQVKNNYLDAVFLLSKVYAAKGDLSNSIIAARVATQLNPQNPLLFFQLGILNYQNKDYSNAIEALSKAVSIQPDYSNAKYFLGLSLARMSSTTGAVAQFEDLVQMNPDNQEVKLILNNLKTGKSIFSDAKPPVTTAPEKRSNLPIKEKR